MSMTKALARWLKKGRTAAELSAKLAYLKDALKAERNIAVRSSLSERVRMVEAALLKLTNRPRSEGTAAYLAAKARAGEPDTLAANPLPDPRCTAEEHDDTNVECICSRSMRLQPIHASYNGGAWPVVSE